MSYDQNSANLLAENHQLAKELADAKAALTEERELISKLLTDSTYEGGVQYWIAKHDAVMLREAKAYAQLATTQDKLAEIETGRIARLVRSMADLRHELAETQEKLAAAENYRCRSVAACVEEFTAKLAQCERERDDLKGWKAEMLAILNALDLQKVGRLLGVPLGEMICMSVVPGIEKLQAQLTAERALSDRLAVAMQTCNIGTDVNGDSTQFFDDAVVQEALAAHLAARTGNPNSVLVDPNLGKLP